MTTKTVNVRERYQWAVLAGAHFNSRLLGNLLTVLTSYADEDGYCFPGRKSLATVLWDASEPSKRHFTDLDKLIQHAANLGLIQIEPRFTESGRQTTNGYLLRFPDLRGTSGLTPDLPSDRTSGLTPDLPSGLTPEGDLRSDAGPNEGEKKEGEKKKDTTSGEGGSPLHLSAADASELLDRATASRLFMVKGSGGYLAKPDGTTASRRDLIARYRDPQRAALLEAAINNPDIDRWEQRRLRAV